MSTDLLILVVEFLWNLRIVGSWAAISYIMTAKGNDYLLFSSIGGALFIFCLFCLVCLSQTTIVSQIAVSKNYISLKSVFRSGLTLVTIMILITSVPLLVCPISVFHFYFLK